MFVLMLRQRQQKIQYFTKVVGGYINTMKTIFLSLMLRSITSIFPNRSLQLRISLFSLRYPVMLISCTLQGFKDFLPSSGFLNSSSDFPYLVQVFLIQIPGPIFLI